MPKKSRKRRKRTFESTALVPLATYQNETACRLWIAWLEGQLVKARRMLARLIEK